MKELREYIEKLRDEAISGFEAEPHYHKWELGSWDGKIETCNDILYKLSELSED